MDAFFDHFLKHVKGLGFAVSIFTTLVLDRPDEMGKTAVTWAAVFFLYRFGRVLDDAIYDPLFGTEGLFKRTLKNVRESAKEKFDQLRWTGVGPEPTFKGLYAVSEKAFEHSDAWERRVELWLELSKAARTFVLPLAILFDWNVCGVPLPTWLPQWLSGNSWLRSSSIVGWSLVASLMLYVGLRLLHNWAMYRLVTDADDHASQITIETLPRKPKPGEPVYSFYCSQLGSCADLARGAIVEARCRR